MGSPLEGQGGKKAIAVDGFLRYGQFYVLIFDFQIEIN
jgi:hypothetical protein